MKRKKWTEEEELTLIRSYSSSTTATATATTSSSSKPKLLLVPVSRQKRFQPIADRVNSLHHLSDPSSFPFLWSWRDIAIKIHNMRHQYLNVKHKILLNSTTNSLSNSTSDWDHALDLWPNFLRYKQVFGDVDLDTSKNNNLNLSSDEMEEEEEEEHCRKKRKRLRRREERREQEDLEWIERVVVMQMEHEKQAMQMHADACQAQLHTLGILVRFLCHFIGPGSTGGDAGGGLPAQVVQNLQQQQRQQRGEEGEVEDEETAEGLVGDENENEE